MKIVVDKNNINEVLAQVEIQAMQALEMIGQKAETNAKLEITSAVYNGPEAKSGYVRTGNLRNSITHQMDMGAKAVYVGTPVKYAPYVELGTIKMPERPYLKPAIENHLEEYQQIFEQALK